MRELRMEHINSEVNIPDNKEEWFQELCCRIIEKHFFCNSDDLYLQLRENFEDIERQENYWEKQLNDDNRFVFLICSMALY